MKTIQIENSTYVEILSQQEIAKNVSEIAQRIKLDYPNDGNLVLLCVTNGGIYFGVDLSRALQDIGVSSCIATVGIHRYKEDGKTTEIKITSEPSLKLVGKNVIIIEDLIDEGITLSYLDNYLKTTKDMTPLSTEYCILVEKKGHKKLKFNVKYCMIRNAGSEWLIGYGMDSNFGYRGLRGIYKKGN